MDLEHTRAESGLPLCLFPLTGRRDVVPSSGSRSRNGGFPGADTAGGTYGRGTAMPALTIIPALPRYPNTFEKYHETTRPSCGDRSRR